MWFIKERPKFSLSRGTDEKYRCWRGQLLNSGVFRTGSNEVCKRIPVGRGSLERVSRRLERIRADPPAHVARLYSYRHRGEAVELRMEEIHGQTLHEFAHTNAITMLRSQFDRTLSKWRTQGFIHGDLSPANILVAASSGITRREAGSEAWFIDWVADLEGFEGTPRYASPETFAGRRSHDSDAHAVTEIFKDYDRGFRSLKPLVLLRYAGTNRKHPRRGFTFGRGATPEKKTGGTLCAFGHTHPRCAAFLF